jgi:hypothetical protein
MATTEYVDLLNAFNTLVVKTGGIEGGNAGDCWFDSGPIICQANCDRPTCEGALFGTWYEPNTKPCVGRPDDDVKYQQLLQMLKQLLAYRHGQHPEKVMGTCFLPVGDKYEQLQTDEDTSKLLKAKNWIKKKPK